MLDSGSLSSGTPIPAVDASDLKRVWQMISELRQELRPERGCVGLDVRLFTGQCSPGADLIALWARVALLGLLLDLGVLDEWRDPGGPRDGVFEAIAAYPLPEGVQGFDPEAFAEALRNNG